MSFRGDEYERILFQMPRVFPNRDYLHKSFNPIWIVGLIFLILVLLCAGGIKFEKNPKPNPENTKHVKVVGI